MIKKFEDEYEFLSNFHPSPFTYMSVIWPTVEHAFQACKLINPTVGDLQRFADYTTPNIAKRSGRMVKLRPDWEVIKVQLMYNLVYEKFKQNKKLRKMLLDTVDEILIEGNTWHDNIWGNCTCSACKDIRGENYLGRILMLVRMKLGQEQMIIAYRKKMKLEKELIL